MKSATVKNKEIDVSRILNWVVEKEHDAEQIVFDFPNASDISQYDFYLLFRNKENTGGREHLTKTVSGATMRLTWIPSSAFTSVMGKVDIQIAGFEFTNIGGTYSIAKRWSTIYSTINIMENIEAEETVDARGQSYIEDLICADYVGQS